MRRALLSLTTLAVLVVAAPAGASEFCGCNGVMILSFTDGPTITSTARRAPHDGPLEVDVYAILDEVEPVEGPGGMLLAIGGFECDLAIEGAEPQMVTKEVLVPSYDFGKDPAQVWAGLRGTGQRIDEGPIKLVRWTVRFAGHPTDVRFTLDRGGLLSCKGFATCEDADARGIYNGTSDMGQSGALFGTACVPAVLNPTGEPDLERVGCTLSVTEAGVFEPR